MGIGEFAQALFLKENDLLIMLALYGDGSGEHGKRDGTSFVLAGYMASTIDWFQIERDWVAALEESPRIQYFKASECIMRDGGFKGQFKGWDTAAVEAKRLRMAYVIRRHNNRMVELSSVIRWDEYDSVLGDDVMRKTYYHPFHFGFHGIASLAIEQGASRFTGQFGPIAFVFDTESKSLDSDIEFQYKYARDTLPEHVSSRLGSLSFCDDKKYLMIQTADLLAWSIRAEKESLPSPVLGIIRDPSAIGGSLERRWRRDGLEQFIIKTETEYHKRFG